jgi:O-antigen/teichoic acid export membrane protein
MFVMAEPLVIILFGSKWNKAIPILQILSLYAMVRSIINPVGTLLLSKGKVKLSFYWNASMTFIVPIVIFIGSYYGLKGIAYAHLISMVVSLFAAWRILVYPTCYATFSEFFGQIIKPLKVGIGLFIVLFAIDQLPAERPWLKVVSGGIALLAVILPLNKFFNEGFYLEIINTLKPLYSRFKRSQIQNNNS